MNSLHKAAPLGLTPNPTSVPCVLVTRTARINVPPTARRDTMATPGLSGERRHQRGASAVTLCVCVGGCCQGESGIRRAAGARASCDSDTPESARWLAACTAQLCSSASNPRGPSKSTARECFQCFVGRIPVTTTLSSHSVTIFFFLLLFYFSP